MSAKRAFRESPEEYVLPGNSACQGCGSTLALRWVLKALGKRTVIVNPASCGCVYVGLYPRTAVSVPYIQMAFAAAPSAASGIVGGLEAKGETDITVMCWAGDGGTVDIGFQALSGALERGHDFTYICLDNEAYMNTGIQRSGATPYGAWTTTSAVGKAIRGKVQWKKNMPAIVASHGIPYVATACPAYPVDLVNKVKRAVEVEGPAYVHVLTPCVPGWRIPSNISIKVARLAVQTGIFPLYEIKDGKLTLTVKVPKRPPEEKDSNPSDSSVSIYVGDNRTFSVYAEDPDGDNITYAWYLDGEKVLSGNNATNYTYHANESDVGTHTLRVVIDDGYDTSSVTWTISVDVTSATEVKTLPEYVYAGRKYNVTILIWNNIWQGTVDVDISYPEYVAMFSDTHWTFRDVRPNDTVTIILELYVPAKVLTSFGEVSLIGQTLSISLDISFVDKYGRSHQESRTAEFIIRGEIDLRLFSKSVEPGAITPGDVVSVSVTVLNVGVSSAQYANASIIQADFIELLAESFTYIGEIEPGAPIPVILKFKIKENISPGTYTVYVKICYFDDIYNEHFLLVEFTFTVTQKESESSTETSSGPTLEEYLTAIYVGGVIAAAVAAIVVIKRRHFTEK